MATIRQHGSKHQVRGMFRGVKIPSASFTDEDDARKYKREEERRIELGIYYVAPAETFGAFLDAHIERKKKMGFSAGTIRENRSSANNLRGFRDRPIPVLRRAEVEDWLAAMGPRRASELALGLLKAVLRSAQDRGQQIDVGILTIKPPRYEKRDVQFLDVPDIYRLSSWMPEYVRRIVIVAAITGLRQGELFDLKEQDLDFDLAHLYVQRGKTKASRRTVILTKEGVSLLRDQLMARPAKDTDRIFPAPGGKRWRKDNFRGRVFVPAAVAAGLGTLQGNHYEGVTFHHLRHTYVSLGARAGVTQEVIEKLAGWAPGSARAMYEHYRHVYPVETQAAVAMLDALLAAEA